MGDDVNNIVKKIKLVFKSLGAIIATKALPVIVIFVILAGAVYLITLDDGTYKEGDMSNVPYAASQYTSNPTVSNSGEISSSMTAQELWDLMVDEGSIVGNYLSSAKELKKLMNAEVVTQFLDTRANPDEEIDWDSINDDPETNELQGIIKLKRKASDGSISTMTYVDPDTFQSYINEYNSSGSSTAKDNALKHFTLVSGVSAGSVGGIITGTGDFTQYIDLTDEQIRKIANLCKQEQGSLEGAAAEASLMANRFELYGSSHGTGGNGLYNYVRNSRWFANAAHHMDNGSASEEYIDVVKAVLVNGKRTIPRYIDEHVTFERKYIIKSTNNDVNIDVMDRSAYSPHTTIIYQDANDNNLYDEDPYTFYCFPTDTSDPFGYSSETKRAELGDAYYDYDTGALVNGEEESEAEDAEAAEGEEEEEENSDAINGDVLFWPVDSTRVTSGYGPRPPPVPGASPFHEAIDIAAAVGDPVYACESGVVLDTGYISSGGNYVKIEHDNGDRSVYYHNDSILVSTGDRVTKGQQIAKAGATGGVTGPHLDFRIWDKAQGKYIDPLTRRYHNGMGNGTSTPASGTSGGAQYYAVVASWNETNDKIESNDPDETTSNETVYNMTTTNVNYQQLVNGYTMPFQYLWSMLVISEDEDFVMDLADLVYNSKIEITVHDNLTTNTNVEVNTYTKKKKTDTEADVTVNGVTGETVVTETAHGEWTDEGDVGNYTTTHTTITKTNTLDVSLTLADVWMAKYVQGYNELVAETIGGDTTEEDLEDIPYSETPDATGTSDTYGHGQALLNQKKTEMTNSGAGYTSVNGTKTVSEEIYYSSINRKKKITNTIVNTKHVSFDKQVTEKTDKNAPESEPNFVTIFLDPDNRKGKYNILSVESWLFELLEENDSTKDMVDLTKYLLYKATDTDYGVTEMDFEVFSNSAFNTVTGIYGGTLQEKIWFAVRDAGFSEYCAAGVLGNIYQESRYNPELVNEIGASGLCQWLGGRKNKLIAYANSKGVSWQDEDTQIEFLIAEITPGGKGIAEYQLYNATYRNQFINATNTDDATEAFCWGFERCGEGEAMLEVRKGEAADRYTEFHGRTTASTDSRIGEIRLSGGNANKMAAMLTEACRIADDSRYTYSQENRMSEFQYDCSSLVSRLYQRYFGITTPNVTAEYSTSSPYYKGAFGSVQLQPGDVLWREGHVEIYIGNNNRVGAHSGLVPNDQQISVEPMSTNWTRVYRFVN